MKRLMLISLIALTAAAGCGSNDVTRSFGGEKTIELDPGRKLEEITWKDADIFLLTRPMREDEKPETHTFQEISNWGIWEGTVTIVEKEAD